MAQRVQSQPKVIWTPHLIRCDEAANSPRFGALLKARLVDLALFADGKTSIEALKLLLGASEGVVQRDPVLAAVPVEELEKAYERAAEYLELVAGVGGEGGDRTDQPD